MNLAKFPRRGYVTEPTPLEALPNFSKALGADINIYIKRDDLLPGTAGGNKTRKLDFSMADAINQGADTIITCGAVQSNHCRLTLAWAVKEGLDCHLVLEERVKDSYNPEASGNNFLFQLLGVKSVTVVPGGSNMLGEMEKLAEKLRAEGKKPYIVPGGASNKIGALGYVSCAEEVLRQLFDRGLAIDHMVVPSGSAAPTRASSRAWSATTRASRSPASASTARSPFRRPPSSTLPMKPSNISVSKPVCPPKKS